MDTDWGGCKIDRRSYAGFTFKLFSASITWESRKQKTVALSSTEAEYVAMSEAIRELVYIYNFLTELGFGEVSILKLFYDNQSARELAVNLIQHN